MRPFCPIALAILALVDQVGPAAATDVLSKTGWVELPAEPLAEALMQLHCSFLQRCPKHDKNAKIVRLRPKIFVRLAVCNLSVLSMRCVFVNRMAFGVG